MCTRGVWQLQVLVVRYCPIGGSSKGIREYIRGPLLDYAEKNPQITFKAIHGKGKHPCIEARYVTGSNKVADVKNKTPKQIHKLVELFRNTTGAKVKVFKIPQYTSSPSLQGPWYPGAAKNVRFELETHTGRAPIPIE